MTNELYRLELEAGAEMVVAELAGVARAIDIVGLGEKIPIFEATHD